LVTRSFKNGKWVQEARLGGRGVAGEVAVKENVGKRLTKQFPMSSQELERSVMKATQSRATARKNNVLKDTVGVVGKRANGWVGKTGGL